MSLLEILLSMTLVSILTVTAYLYYSDYVNESRKVSTWNRMDAIRKALESWHADHKSAYPTTDLEPLLGRYLPTTEEDGWGNEFVVDPYFGRLISRGPDAVLDTYVVGHPESRYRGATGDDVVRNYDDSGRIYMLDANGWLMSCRPDLADATQMAQVADGGDKGPASGVGVYSNGASLYRVWIDEDGRTGDYQLGMDVGAQPMTWITTRLPAANFGAVAVAPDGIHFAVLQDAGGDASVVVGELVDSAQSAPPAIVATVPGLPLTARLSYDRQSSTIYFSDGTQIRSVSSAPGSQITTPGWGTATGLNTTAADLCASRDRIAFIRDGLTYILTVDPATGANYISRDVVFGSNDLLLAFNRKCDALAVTGTNSLWIWWPDRPPVAGINPSEVATSGALADLGITMPLQDLKWR